MKRYALGALALLVLLSGGCKSKKSGGRNLAAENKVAPRIVKLFFESPAMLLVPESRSVDLPQNPSGAMSAVARELLKGPAAPAAGAAPSDFQLLPADTVLRGAFLLPDGTAFVDLGGPTLSQGWATGSHQELMAVYSIVQTLSANFPEVRRVRILLNGVPAETLGGHIAVDRSLTPNPSLVDSRVR